MHTQQIGIGNRARVFARLRSEAEWTRALSAPAPLRELSAVAQPGALGLPSGAAQLLADSLSEVGQGLGAYHAEAESDVWARAHRLAHVVEALRTALAQIDDENAFKAPLPAVGALVRDLLAEVAPRERYLTAVVEAYSIESGLIAEIPMVPPSQTPPALRGEDLLPVGITAADLLAAIHPAHRASEVSLLLRELFGEWSREAKIDAEAPPFWIWLETK